MINTREYFNELAKVFKWLDKENTGYIKTAQIGDLWYFSGIDGSSLFPKLIEELDSDKSGKISTTEITKYIEARLIYKYSRSELMEALKAFEEQSSNKFCVDDLVRALEAYSDIKRDDIEHLIQSKKDKKIDSEYLTDRIMLSK